VNGVESWSLQSAGEQVSDAAADAVYYQSLKIRQRPLLIRYQVTAQKISILRVFHQRQNRR
jgi:hypothetical protein